MADESYWNTTEVKGFDFDGDESNEQVFGVPLKGAALLSQQLKDGFKSDSEYSSHSSSGQHGFIKGAPKYELLQLVSEKLLNAVLEADLVEIPIAKSSLKPDEELRLLRRQVESRWDTPDARATVKSIILGQPYSLELFQSLRSKKDLMDSAISFGDGDAILEVTLFLSRTLKKSLFQQIMFNCPVAVSHYIHYLTTKMQIQEATDLLELLGRIKEASYKQFSLLSSNPQRHLQRLKGLGEKYFFDSKDKIFVDNFARLVARGEMHGKRSGGTADDVQVPPNESFERQIEMKLEVGPSVVATLRTLCEKHWNDGAISPSFLSKEHSVSDKQYQWTALTARAAQQDWDSIHSMFITKGWLGSKKVKSVLPMDQIVLQLHNNKAPENILTTYLELIENVDLKLTIAKKLQCHKVIIDTFGSQRDRQSLKSYMSSLSPHGDNFIYAESVLNSPIKWKN